MVVFCSLIVDRDLVSDANTSRTPAAQLSDTASVASTTGGLASAQTSELLRSARIGSGLLVWGEAKGWVSGREWRGGGGY